MLSRLTHSSPEVILGAPPLGSTAGGAPEKGEVTGSLSPQSRTGQLLSFFLSVFSAPAQLHHAGVSAMG